MKKCLAFILLLSHMNTSMFLPQTPENDVFDRSGQQVDDINSVVEFLCVKLGYDHTCDDEDNDSGQYFHVVKTTDYNFTQSFTNIADNISAISVEDLPCSFLYVESNLTPIALDIIVPPPDTFS